MLILLHLYVIHTRTPTIILSRTGIYLISSSVHLQPFAIGSCTERLGSSQLCPGYNRIGTPSFDDYGWKPHPGYELYRWSRQVSKNVIAGVHSISKHIPTPKTPYIFSTTPQTQRPISLTSPRKNVSSPHSQQGCDTTPGKARV